MRGPTAPADPTESVVLAVAGRSLELVTVGPDARRAVLPALGHLVAEPHAGVSRQRLTVWCSDSAPDDWPPGLEGPLHVGTACGVARLDPPSYELFDPQVGLQLWGSPAALRTGEIRAHPASTAIAEWLATSGALVAHLGAVVVDGSAVLLVGAGGAGKSTTTLACALAGARFLGDDLCIIDAMGGGEATVHSLYATCKLTASGEALIDAAALPTLGHTAVGKRVVLAGGSVPMARAAPIRSIVMLRPPATGPGSPRRVAPTSALQPLLATWFLAAAGSNRLQAWFRTATTLLREVPVFELGLSPDVARVVDGVAATVAGVT